MKKRLNEIRDTFFAGIIFLLPLLILFVVISKVFSYFTGITGKIAAMLGVKTFLGVSGSNLVFTVLIILVCLLCGYLVRMKMFKWFSDYLDKKFVKYIPGYEGLSTAARSKLERKGEELSFKGAAWISTQTDVFEPGFVVDKLSQDRYLIFLPIGGNIKEGKLLVLPSSKVQPKTETDVKAFQAAIGNRGFGLAVD